MSPLTIVAGDLLRQDVAVIVNAWNEQWLPWWLLRPAGVSGAIKSQAGTAPFRELAAAGRLVPGQAVRTGAGRLPFAALIHVAVIRPWSRTRPEIVAAATANALDCAAAAGDASIALPLLGSGSAGLDEETALATMTTVIESHPYTGPVTLVRYSPGGVSG